MAKRKSRKATKKPPKKQMKPDTFFKCPFCNEPNSVDCIIDKKVWAGEATCLVCKEAYTTTITDLTEPTDIYHEWVEECILANYNSGDDASRENLD